MNGRKKLLCTFLLAFFLYIAVPFSAFAEPVSSKAESSSKAQSSSAASATSTQSSTPVVSSSAAPASSKAPASTQAPSSKTAVSKTASSRKPRKVISYAVTSSGTDSAVSSEIISSEPESGVISLPGVDSVAERDPLASVSNSSNSHMTQLGILAWVCIALGILVVLIVIFSNRRGPRGPGRSRYHRPKRSGKKHLLNDRYYRGLRRY